MFPSHALYVAQSYSAFQNGLWAEKAGPRYAEKSCSVFKGHPPTQATLGQPIARVGGATGEIPRSLATLALRK